MSDISKLQRIRDPVHNLIEFDEGELERTLWRVVQSRPFQRLRRVRQLGFSELVFPGATHTRFSHSLGVFHTARNLMKVIERHAGNQIKGHQAQVALAAALVHDLGHGMFSHAFEDIGKKLNLSMAKHELVGESLILNSEISEIFSEMGSGFAKDVASVLSRKNPSSLYDTVVSSQFDADRLDYMQRDRLMAGVQSSAIDVTWLIANLEIANVKISADDDQSGSVDTLVLGSKAFHAAENYVLSLFQLYPNVYFHKTTRGAEKVFSQLMMRVFKLSTLGQLGKSGLPTNHPFRKFAKEPDSIARALDLDDALFWGALPLMADAKDLEIRKYSEMLRDRHLPKCVDIKKSFEELNPGPASTELEDRRMHDAKLRIACKNTVTKIKEFSDKRSKSEPRILIDEARRDPYKKFQDSNTLLNQILIRRGEDLFEDMAQISAVVASAETFEVCRAYYEKDDSVGKDMIENEIRTYSWEN